MLERISKLQAFVSNVAEDYTPSFTGLQTGNPELDDGGVPEEDPGHLDVVYVRLSCAPLFFTYSSTRSK